jgi:hypothetical protein
MVIEQDLVSMETSFKDGQIPQRFKLLSQTASQMTIVHGDNSAHQTEKMA